MAKIVALLPNSELLLRAEKLAPKYHLEFLYLKAISSETAAAEAEAAVAAGAEIILARGVQAYMIRKKVSIPVVEVLLTGQEMGQLVSSARSMLPEKEKPVVAVIGFANMFCDMSSFDELYDVELREYFVRESEQLAEAAERAMDEGADAVIGGEVVCSTVQERDGLALFLSSGQESIAEACRVAEKVAYATDQEKKNTAEFRVLLDYSFNGIIKVSREGIIEHINHFVEKLLDVTEQQVLGTPLHDVLPSIESELRERVLERGEEVYSTVFNVRQTAVVANIAPILLDGEVQGAILSCHEGRQVVAMAAGMRRELRQMGHTAHHTFEDLVAESSQSKRLVEKARTCAKFNAPVLLTGAMGTEKDLLAQCIHNASVCSNDAFVSFSCESLPREELSAALFGAGEGKAAKGLADLAEGGILFVDQVSRLDRRAQYQLLRLIQEQVLDRGPGIRPAAAHVRVIAADEKDLSLLTERGEFLPELYHALSVLHLTLHPLRERREDVKGWVLRLVEGLEKRYDRYIRLTSGAMELLLDQKWDGNLPELRAFCERMVILSPKRTVDERIIRDFLTDGNESVRSGDFARNAPKRDAKAARLEELMEVCHGNRALIAKEMKISATTLWRYMKKYGISDK
ncbi:MAG: hypothetical protein EOM52_07880 [Clostridia bacterium]|nr:hypothetical protein [Clostridia bacterium]